MSHYRIFLLYSIQFELPHGLFQGEVHISTLLSALKHPLRIIGLSRLINQALNRSRNLTAPVDELFAP